MARNRQRARDRKQRKQSDGEAGQLDDRRTGDDPIVGPSVGQGVPPDDLGTQSPPVDFDEEPDDDPAGGVGGLQAPGTPKKVGVGRVVPFLRACSAELQRVQWPDRRQVGQATAVVLGFVVIAGAFLGLADVVAQRIVDLIL